VLAMKKILCIRFSSIGDIVLTSPVIRCLKKQTGAKIHFLTKSKFISLLTSNPYIDQVHTLEANFQAQIKSLDHENFDLIVDLHKNYRSNKFRISLGVKTIGFDKINLEKWLKVNLKIDRLPEKHLVDRYFEALEELKIFYDGKGLDFYIPAEYIAKTNQNYPQISKTIVIAIGGSAYTKKMPANKIRYLCGELSLPVILIGGLEDEQLGRRIAEGLPYVENLCGRLNLLQSAAIIRDCRLLISHDTGMMHIGAAFKKRLLCVWGNTIPSFGMYPFYPQEQKWKYHNIEVEGLKCRPCSKLGYDKCPQSHFRCMEDQDIEAIITTVEKLLVEEKQ